jgi:hypothetical protein
MKMDIKPSPDALKLTSLVTESAADPILIYDDHAALCMGIVDRSTAHLLGNEWDLPGVYVLLDPIEPDGGWGTYVGKAPAGLRSRLLSHLKNKDHWSRAVLICRDTTHGLNSAQIGWLEGRLYDFLKAADATSMHNGNRPSDETLPPYERTMLEACVIPISRTLRLLGYDASAPGDEPSVKAHQSKNFYGVTLKQLIDQGVVDADSQLTSLNNAWPASGVVNKEGSVTVDGVEYPTPSAAASAVRGGAANGWEFWGVEGPLGPKPLSVLRSEFMESKSGVPSE